jgi:hypothetical protein
MLPYKLIREIQVSEKATDKVVEEILLLEMDVDRLNMIFGEQTDDPLFYGGFEITRNLVQYFPDIKFDLDRYDYYVVCSRELTETELEILTINRYFQKDKAKRFVDFVMKDKNRAKFISTLAHTRDLDYSKFRKVEKREKEFVMEMLSKQKLSKCYVISENKKIDGLYMNSEKALDSTIGYGMGTILVFGDAEIIFYEGEEPGNSWVSVKR